VAVAKPGRDLLTGAQVSGSVEIPAFGVCIVKES
jgi:hypothetical protein